MASSPVVEDLEVVTAAVEGFGMTMVRAFGRVLAQDWQRVGMGPRTGVMLRGLNSRRCYWSLTLDSPSQAHDYAADLRERLVRVGPERLLVDLRVPQ